MIIIISFGVSKSITFRKALAYSYNYSAYSQLLYKFYIIISLSRNKIPIDTKNLMILLHHLVIAKGGPVGVERVLYEYDERGYT